MKGKRAGLKRGGGLRQYLIDRVTGRLGKIGATVGQIGKTLRIGWH
jgi:hypothetical protein